MATLTLQSTPVPLAEDAGGVLRVGGTRVRLEMLITAFRLGATPEEITSQFPTLSLADVYAVITYYLQHKDEVDAYMEEYEQEGAHMEKTLRERYDHQGFRERLLARHR